MTKPVLVLSKFPTEFMAKKIIPALARYGFDNARVEHPLYINRVPNLGSFRAVVFMKDMGGHIEVDVASTKAKQAGALFLALPRHTSEWPDIFAMAHVPTPAVIEDEPPSDAVRLVQRGTFGAALRAARESDGFTVGVVAEVIGISEEELLVYETDAEPIPMGIYAEMLGVFPVLHRVTAKPDLCADPVPTEGARVFAEHAQALMEKVFADGKKSEAVTFHAAVQAVTPTSTKVPERSFSAIVSAIRVLGKGARVHLIVGEDDTAAIEIEGEGDTTLFAWQGKDADEAIDAARLDLDERLTTLETRIAHARRGLRVSV
jgi:hypothetical protein